jgi:hypothetical protein
VDCRVNGIIDILFLNIFAFRVLRIWLSIQEFVRLVLFFDWIDFLVIFLDLLAIVDHLVQFWVRPPHRIA